MKRKEVARPGAVQLTMVGAGPIRGMNLMGGLLYLVSGTSLYSMSSTDAPPYKVHVQALTYEPEEWPDMFPIWEPRCPLRKS